MTAWRVAAWTHPEDPAGFIQRDHALPILSFDGNDPEEPRGRCRVTLPATYDWESLIAVADPTDPADTSLLRLYREGQDNTDPPDIEFKLIRFAKRFDDDLGEVVDLFGQDWRLAALEQAVLRWWDWTPGAAVTLQPDWEYGGRNVLGDGFETDQATQETTYKLWIDATGGSYDLGDGVDDTTLAWNADADDIEDGLELDLASITDVNVPPAAGTEEDPFLINFVTPPFGVDLIVDDTALTGGGATAHLSVVTAGQIEPGRWTVAQEVSSGTPIVYGAMASDGFRVSDEQAHTGTYSLRVNPLDIDTWGRYPGAQVVVNVTPGLWQASIWVRPTSATDEYRFVLRTIYGDELQTLSGGLATGTGTFAHQTFAANTWTEVTITDVVIPAGIDQIIFRFSNVQASGNPNVFYLDDPYLAKGLPADTWGKIANDIIDDANVDHVATVPRLTYITGRTWTDSVDSSSTAWSRDESITLRPGLHYGLHLFGGVGRDLGYVYDITPGATPTDPEWDMHIWEKANWGTTHDDIAFIVGFGVSGGLVAGRIPNATRYLAEGAGGLIIESVNAAQETATGVVEEFVQNADITDATTLAGFADHLLEEDLANRLAVTVELGDGAPTPYADFVVGDLAYFAAAGSMDKHERRISEITLQAAGDTNGDIAWSTTVTASRLLIGEAAVKEAVYRYLTDYERHREHQAVGPTTLSAGGGGAPTVVVAAFDASETSKRKADFFCDGENDDVTLQDVVDQFATFGCLLILTEGTFNLSSTWTVSGSTWVRGAGVDATFVIGSVALGATVSLGDNGKLSDFYVENTVDNTLATGVEMTGSGLCENLRVFSFGGIGIDMAADECTVEGCTVSAETIDVQVSGVHMRVAHNRLEGRGDGISVAASSRDIFIEANHIDTTGSA